MSQTPLVPDSCPTLQIIADHAQEGVTARQQFFATEAKNVRQCALLMARTLAKGRKILLCGNGGSAADAQHIAAELVTRFLLDRPPLPALALTTDSSILTAIGNDFSFEQVFAKQVMALGQPEDMLIGISTSGTSANVLAALRAARQRGMVCAGLTGASDAMRPMCDCVLSVSHASTPIIQEVHIAAAHMLCRLVDYFLFENVSALSNSE